MLIKLSGSALDFLSLCQYSSLQVLILVGSVNNLIYASRRMAANIGQQMRGHLTRPRHID
ncbi:uncharacterized protein BDW47DRAFT_105446 [Aspergillus candidus]|uniref:Uncharacterized protein n=1 Tax=Aspergillus candidus TaxID=41067 RepID=A0A2I2FC47_ASPCN|nr:hypothetical protein BDW47DRAFT_105446 [Aspergillus candidus]PLB38185.1 hypothetical protein BDW47DRAFT_105446 [Aspergillus candidus]